MGIPTLQAAASTTGRLAVYQGNMLVHVDAATARTIIGAQANLGFAPVQQGGGAGQGTNKIYVGWDGTSALKAQVDAVDLGQIWTDYTIGGNRTAKQTLLFGAPITSFTPTITWVTGSGTASATMSYLVVGNVIVVLSLVINITSAAAGSRIAVSFPITPVGVSILVGRENANTGKIQQLATSGNFNDYQNVQTLTAGDVYIFSGVYEK